MAENIIRFQRRIKCVYCCLALITEELITIAPILTKEPNHEASSSDKTFFLCMSGKAGELYPVVKDRKVYQCSLPYLVLDWTLSVVKFMTWGPRIWPPLPTGGHRVKWKDTCVFDWAHSPGAMIWGPIEYKDKDTKTQFLPETKSL